MEDPFGLRQLAAADLLALSRAVLRELRGRGVIRTGNAPAGDYAELLVRIATGGTLALNSQKSWDVLSATGERIQVKARIVTNPASPGERQLSVFRSWDFDHAVIVLFDDHFRVWRASCLLPTALQEAATWAKHVSGWRVMARDELLASGTDWTNALTFAAQR